MSTVFSGSVIPPSSFFLSFKQRTVSDVTVRLWPELCFSATFHILAPKLLRAKLKWWSLLNICQPQPEGSPAASRQHMQFTVREHCCCLRATVTVKPVFTIWSASNYKGGLWKWLLDETWQQTRTEQLCCCVSSKNHVSPLLPESSQRGVMRSWMSRFQHLDTPESRLRLSCLCERTIQPKNISNENSGWWFNALCYWAVLSETFCLHISGQRMEEMLTGGD